MSPITIGGTVLRNRITRTAHGTGYAVHGMVTERLIAYHEARARGGGVGSLFLETCGVHPSSPGPLWALRDEIVPGWAELAERLHRHDTKVFAQLWHGGAQAPPPDGTPSWAPSAIPDPINGRVAQAMTRAMIDEIVEGFAAAARRAQEAGLDGVEVHGAHSYLVSAFLSPMTNLRTDDYGGPLENRWRFLREVMAAIRSACGDGYVLGVRIAPEAVAGGLTAEELERVRVMLEDERLVDFVDVSLGSYHNFAKLIGAMHEPHGYELPTSEIVTRGARVPTIVTGRILTLAAAEQVIASGVADIVSMVRALLADPELVVKSLEGREHEVRPCIGCNEACVGRRFAIGAAVGQTGCTVNPHAGFEHKQAPLVPAAPPRSVLVVGAGPAGLEAARTAALRGHRVVVHEQAEDPGGLPRLHRRAPFRDEIGKIGDWLWQELDRLGVERRLGSRVDLELVLLEAPDAVVVATGSLPLRDGVQRMRPAHRVEGIDLPHVVTPLEVLDGEVAVPARAVVFDDLGNYQAVGSAEWLLEQGAEVVFATSHASFAPDLFRSFQRDSTAERLGRYPGYRLVVRTSIERVTPETVVLRWLDGDREEEVEAGLLVMVTGFEPQTALFDELREAGIEAHAAGDAVAPLLMPHAIASGYEAGAAV